MCDVTIAKRMRMLRSCASKRVLHCERLKFLYFSNRVRNMKLLTHNMLTSKCMKGVTIGYPLGIVARDIKVHETEFNLEFIQRLIPKLDWDVVYKAADSIGYADDLPEKLSEDYENDSDLLRKAHHILLEVEIIDGDLVCPETGRKFPINNGIPNMLLNEDEL